MELLCYVLGLFIYIDLSSLKSIKILYSRREINKTAVPVDIEKADEVGPGGNLVLLQ